VETTAFRIVLDTILKGDHDPEGSGSQWVVFLGAAFWVFVAPVVGPPCTYMAPHACVFFVVSRF